MLKSLYDYHKKCEELWGISPKYLKVKNRRKKWLYSNVTNVALPRKADVNRKNALHVLKQEPCRNRAMQNLPAAAVQQKNKGRSQAPADIIWQGLFYFNFRIVFFLRHPQPKYNSAANTTS